MRRLLLPACLTLVLLACKRSESGPAAHDTTQPPSPPAPTIAVQPTTPAVATTMPPPPAPTEVIEAPDGALLAGKDTYAVIAGVLSFAEPGVAGWSAKNRKDLELYQLLRSRGVPTKNLELLLDDKATHANVAAALKRVAKRAPAGSTLLFYYAGHGTRDKSGKPYFLAYDTKSRDMPNTGIAVSGVADTLTQHFSGRRVVLMADCCYSGTLKDVADTVAEKKKIEAVSITSADASNLSTSNWTFTQTVIDGLRGDGLMDRDRNGTVNLAELGGSVADEMKFREKQRHGFHLRGLTPNTAIAKAAKVEAGAGPHKAGSYVLASYDHSMRTAQVRKAGKDTSLVRFYHYSHSEERQVANSDLQALKFRRYKKDAKLKVYWGGKLWDAQVTKAEGDFHFITYPGWPAYWDEWVMSDRIADTGPEGAGGNEKVQIEWRGKWWPGVILKKQGKRYLVHYDGYGPEWDEWVTEARLKRKAGAKKK